MTVPSVLALEDAEDLIARIDERARWIRREVIRLIAIPKVGHYASAFSCAEILATLYYGVMRLKRGEPRWEERDRFMFGKGHAAVALYPILADFDFIPAAVLNEYTRLGNPLGDHPGMTRVPAASTSVRIDRPCAVSGTGHVHGRAPRWPRLHLLCPPGRR